MENVDLIRRQRLAAVVAICSQFVRSLFENEAVSSADEIYGELAGHEKWDALALFQHRLKSRGVDFLMPQAERLGIEAVCQYLSVKKRQILVSWIWTNSLGGRRHFGRNSNPSCENWSDCGGQFHCK